MAENAGVSDDVYTLQDIFKSLDQNYLMHLREPKPVCTVKLTAT